MKNLNIILLLMVLTNTLTYAQNYRNGIFSNRDRPAGDPNTKISSLFTVGSMIGCTFALTDLTTYKVRNNIVVIDKIGTTADKFNPAIYVFPSINLVGTAGNSLSAIVPININSIENYSAGIGLSYGFKIFNETTEAGIALTAIWSKKDILNYDQQLSLDNKSPLPKDVSLDFSKGNTVLIGLGIYIAPLLGK